MLCYATVGPCTHSGLPSHMAAALQAPSPHCCLFQSCCPHRLFFPHEIGILLGTGERRGGVRLVASCRLCRCSQGTAVLETSVQRTPSPTPFSLGAFVGVRPDPTFPDPGCRTPASVRGSRCRKSRRAGCPHGAGLHPATAQTFRCECAKSMVSCNLPPSWLKTSRATSRPHTLFPKMDMRWDKQLAQLCHRACRWGVGWEPAALPAGSRARE